MPCCFCRAHTESVAPVSLCPDCLAQLLSVSPEEPRYDWFVSAMRRSLSAMVSP